MGDNPAKERRDRNLGVFIWNVSSRGFLSGAPDINLYRLEMFAPPLQVDGQPDHFRLAGCAGDEGHEDGKCLLTMSLKLVLGEIPRAACASLIIVPSIWRWGTQHRATRVIRA